MLACQPDGCLARAFIPRLFREDHLFVASRNAISSAFGFPAETPRSRCRLVRLVAEGSVSFVQTIFLRAVPRFPLIAKGSPLFAPAQSWALVGLSILLTSHQVPSPWHLTASAEAKIRVQCSQSYGQVGHADLPAYFLIALATRERLSFF
jgi:hypothetical protein